MSDGATVVTTWYLEMRHPGWLQPARPAPDLRVLQAEVPLPELNRFLYTAVGAGWWWTDRLGWTYEAWLAYLDRPALETWVGYVSGTPAGYFELERQPLPDGGVDVEIAYFGLLPRFTGRGLGGALLTAATRRAWAMGGAAGPDAASAAGAAGAVRRVWLHTCSLDSPRALANYEARGFRRWRTTQHRQVLPAQRPGPWPGLSVSAGDRRSAAD